MALFQRFTKNLTVKSRLVRWAYLWEDHDHIPEEISLCPLFWRALALSPFKILIAPAALVGVVFAVVTSVQLHHKRLAAGIEGAFAFPGLPTAADVSHSAVVAISILITGLAVVAVFTTVVYFIAYAKANWCPIVRIEGGKPKPIPDVLPTTGDTYDCPQCVEPMTLLHRQEPPIPGEWDEKWECPECGGEFFCDTESDEDDSERSEAAMEETK